VFQSANLFAHLTLQQNVRLAQSLARRRRGTPVPELLDSLGIGARAQATPAQLSGGELARAGLAVALANDPVILLADEPTGELDGGSERQVLDLLAARTRDGVAVLIASHSPAVARAVDRVVSLADGRIAA
jgi:putative ABC transport system ATP-binding protein